MGEYKKIVKRIVELHEKEGWTQSDLAREWGKDRQTMERLENGRSNPTLFTLYELATALEVSVSTLTDL